jgi:hypothetical protein
MQSIVRDYGVRSSYRLEAIGKLVFLVLSGAAMAVVVYGAVGKEAQHRAEVIAEAKAWTITGAPCQSLSARSYFTQLQASDMRATRAFDFMGVTFARAFGHVSCSEIHEEGGRSDATFPVCQFTSPGALEVTSGQGVFYFFPQAGPATISVHGGRPQCVLASKFKG